VPAETPWQQMLRYITSRAPDFYDQVRGASEQEIERALMCCTRPVPLAVVEMFRTMGICSTIFWPFGKRMAVDVVAMLEDPDSLPEEQVIDDRFFRVALALRPEGIDEADFYVDLDYSNGYDAPMTRLMSSWDGRSPRPDGHTLMSMCIQSAFEQFDLARRGEQGYLAKNIPLEEFPKYVESIRALTSRMGLQPIFCPREDLQCYSNASISLMFDAIGAGIDPGLLPGEAPPSDRFLRIWLGVSDLDTLRNVGEQVRTWMPPLLLFRHWRADGKVIDLDHPPSS
jgi:hypothetical protein